MRKTFAAGLAALTFGGAVAAAALPSAADAREWRGGYGYRGDWDRHRHNNNGAAIAAGIAGLAIGAALADSGHRHTSYRQDYYRQGYYDYGYAPGYYYEDDYYRPAVCESRRWVWDPYIGRRVMIVSHYAC